MQQPILPLIIFLVAPNAPFAIEEDAVPAFRTAFLDFTGSGHAPHTEKLRGNTWSAKLHGKGECLAWLSKCPELGAFSCFSVIDHDVVLSISGINRLLFLGQLHQLALFQPSLAHDSFISHAHLANRPGYMVRETTFVESMAPFFSADAYALLKDTFTESVSGYGLDFVWSHRLIAAGEKVAIVDAVIAKHLHPVTSHQRVLPSGETSLQELQRVLRAHRLERYQLR
jgi:hypothetical protein